jgi:hypothetical protein
MKLELVDEGWLGLAERVILDISCPGVHNEQHRAICTSESMRHAFHGTMIQCSKPVLAMSTVHCDIIPRRGTPEAAAACEVTEGHQKCESRGNDPRCS